LFKVVDQFKSQKFYHGETHASPEALECFTNSSNQTCFKVDEAAIGTDYLMASLEKLDFHLSDFVTNINGLKDDAIFRIQNFIDYPSTITHDSLDTLKNDWNNYGKELAERKDELNRLHFLKPIELINKEISQKFTPIWSKTFEELEEVEDKLQEWSISLERFNESSWSFIHGFHLLAENFLDVRTTTTKMDLADYATMNTTVENYQEIKLTLKNLEMAAEEFFRILNKFERDYVRFWKEILENKNTRNYQQYNNFEGFQLNFTEKKHKIEEEYGVMLESKKIEIKLAKVMEDFMHTFSKINSDLELYYKEAEIDEEFLRSNFLFVDFFFRELSLEYMEQQKDYNIFALLSDIGGAMGLLVGATFVSLIECCDHWIHYFFLKRRYNKRSKQC